LKSSPARAAQRGCEPSKAKVERAAIDRRPAPGRRLVTRLPKIRAWANPSKRLSYLAGAVELSTCRLCHVRSAAHFRRRVWSRVRRQRIDLAPTAANISPLESLEIGQPRLAASFIQTPPAPQRYRQCHAVGVGARAVDQPTTRCTGWCRCRAALRTSAI
jgi:hypothetical protein